MINELINGSFGQGVFYVHGKTVGITRATKPFWTLSLMDKTGFVDAKVWENCFPKEIIEPGDFILCTYSVSEFNGVLQLNLQKLVKTEVADPLQFFPSTSYDIEKMWTQVLKILSEVKNPFLQKLLNSFLKDADFVRRFKEASAAEKVHHAFLGGLLQHTVFMLLSGKAVVSVYKMLNRDLLFTAIFLHDIGKLSELSEFPENAYTNAGIFLGHIVIGIMEVAKRCDNISGFPNDLKMEIIHCIAAHHSELEMGSPKKPVIPEAFILSFLDNMDAKLEIVTEQLQKGGGYNKYLQTHVFKRKDGDSCESFTSET